MGYDNKILSPASQDIARTDTEFGSFRFNRLPMGMYDLVDILQAKVYKLLGDIEGVKIYINGILILSRDCFKNHKNYWE